ncbi:hypothetical protein ABE504_27940 [Paenibacillus oryzisoli]|uniref:hypothetical protein n=1 Tax=Paenibacillus oryzisoli TaxID=1850517 RepID=UPI003D2B5739
MARKMKGITVMVVALVFVFAYVTPVAASGNLWYDKYVAAESTLGSASYQSPYSGDLAWEESYLLESYLDMYNVTKSTTWLDKMTSHVDTVIGNASDPDGDGYLGWDTGRYSPPLISNGSFETAVSGDSTMAASWTRWQSTSSTAYRFVSPTPPAGTYGFALLTNGTQWLKIYQNITKYEPGKRLHLMLMGKTSGSPAGGQAYIWDATTSSKICNLDINSTAWEYYQASCTAPAQAGHQLQVWLGHQNYTYTNGVFLVDDVRVGQAYQFVVHDGAITLPIAKFIKLIHETPALQSAYQTKANSYQTFIENEVVPKWENSSYYGNTWVNSGTTEGYYKFSSLRDTYVNNNPGDIVPYNMMLVFADMLQTMYDVNGNASYLDKAKRMNTYWKNRLTANGTAYNWKYSVLQTVAEDTSHGNIDIASAINMFNRSSSLVFDGTDMEKFTDTLMLKMWNGSLTSPTVRQYVDGTGNTTSNSKYLFSWLGFSQFNYDVWKIGAEQYRSFTPTHPLHLQTLSQLMKWDPQKIVNQGFELKTSFDSTQPARWVRSLSTSATAYLDAANASTGSYGLTIKANGSSAQRIYQTWGDWTASASYEVSFDGKTDGTAAGGRIEIYNETTGTSIASYDFTNTAWQSMSFTFTAPANAANTVRVYIGNKDYTVTNGKAHVDNIKIKRSGDSW